jgi:hypothetical protein
MPLPDDIREFTPGTKYSRVIEQAQYWIRDGIVRYKDVRMRGAHLPTFRFYLGGFAKDHKHCYANGRRLQGGNGATFRALNFCYATDGQLVWTIAGKVKDADAQSFVACDDGYIRLAINQLRVPYGFGKDENRVYYYDFDGKPVWVRKADAGTFVSLKDGYFGRDESFVFFGAATLPGAKAAHWQKLGGHYSRDDRRVYYTNRRIMDADYDTFERVPANADYLQLAKDKNHLYWNDRIVTAEEFESMVADDEGPV